MLPLCLVLAAASVNAQPLFNPVANPIQPDPGLVKLFGGEPSIRARQTTLNAEYFASQVNATPGELVINLFPVRRTTTTEAPWSATRSPARCRKAVGCF